MSTFFNKILNTTCRIEGSSSESENESDDVIEENIDIINDFNYLPKLPISFFEK